MGVASGSSCVHAPIRALRENAHKRNAYFKLDITCYEDNRDGGKWGDILCLR